VAEGRRVLLTGVAGQLAGLVARELEQRDDVTELIGVDVREPKHDLRRTEFVRADLRNPLVARILEVAAIDTVVHLSTTAQPGAAGGRARMKERNVIGAMQLFAACQRTPTVRRLVLKSTTAVYGSHHSDPALFREEEATRAAPKHGYGKDATEIEGYLRSFARRRPDVGITILRFANLLGGQVDSAFLSLFSLPVVPRILGYDPRLQFCHEDDAVAVLVRAATEERPGTYNVAGAGMLYLSQCIRLAGRAPLPVPQPLVAGLANLARRSRRVDVSPDQLRFLLLGRGVDTTRLREDFGYTPRYSSRAAFEDFVRRRRITGLLDRDEVVRWEREVSDFLQRKEQERFLAAQRRGEGR
jgi:UDP-glucose 4-epimerase